MLRYFTLNEMEGKTVGSNGKLNIITGFETYLGNFRVIKRMMKEMGVEYTMLCDPEGYSIPRPTANSACTLAVPGSRRSRMHPMPSTPFCCNLGPCQDEEIRAGNLEATGQRHQYPDGSERDRRVSDEGVGTDRQADSRFADPGGAGWWT